MDFVTYKVITNHNVDLATEREKVVREDNKVYRILNQNYQGTISFNSISADENNAYYNALKLKDLLDYTLNDHINVDLDIVILETTPITDVSMRLVDNNEYRFNFDVRFRSMRTIKREVGQYEGANINYGGR